MTDERFTYVNDIREKKAAARGAYAKRTGSKSKRCSLPSDTLTPAQLKRRNSPVSTVKLNQPITYAELQTLSPSLKFLYLDNLIHRFKARRIDLTEMLGCSQNTFAKLVKSLPGKLTFDGKPKHPAPEWSAFLKQADIDRRSGGPIDPSTVEELEAPSSDPEILAGSITLVATLPELRQHLLKLVDESKVYTYTISFTTA